MPSFKPKNNKTIEIDKSSIVTLDNKHEEHSGIFKKNNEYLLPILFKEKKSLIDNINLCKKNRILKQDELLELKDKLKELIIKIKNLKKEEKDYYLNNSKYIFTYFENKKNIADGESSSTKTLNNFFKIYKSKNKCSKDNEIIHKYLVNVDENYIDVNNYIFKTDICSKCNKGELIPFDNEGLLICNRCSVNFKYLIDNDKPSYKEPPKEVCFYAYKRINHFREILAQFQAKETTMIPDEVLENIKLQIQKERLEIKHITNKKAKEILKKLGYNKYYEHIPFIKDKLGIRPPVMSSELEDTLCNLFMEIQGPYAKHCPQERVNFLNYYYTIYKLCELLGQTQFLPYFPMLKDREKRIEQDEIWKLICSDLYWEYIPTI